ncbi:MAG: hypothetical protein J6K26_04605, partial [Lachnospiraceae bacterium]|nr:hypothetical protein [Lachnospiraceae bacterium]
MKNAVTKLLAVCMVIAMVLSTVSGFWGLSAVQAAEGYVIQVSVDKTEVTPGETVSMTVKVTKDGEEIKDLEKAGLKLWWWTDVWADGHTSGLNDAVYSNNDDGKGNSLTADVT